MVVDPSIDAVIIIVVLTIVDCGTNTVMFETIQIYFNCHVTYLMLLRRMKRRDTFEYLFKELCDYINVGHDVYL